MERVKPKTDPIAFIAPAADGWRVYASYSEPGNKTFTAVSLLEEALQTLKPEQPYNLALPVSSVLLEPMQLPSIEASELGGMVRLQLEKTLPYPAEEVTTGFEIIRQTETESILTAVAVHNQQIEEITKTLRQQGHFPDKINVFAFHVAGICPDGQAALIFYKEQGRIVIQISENGKLVYCESRFADEEETIVSELPQLLLTAEVEGVPVQFTRIYLDKECDSLRSRLGEYFGLPVETITFEENLPSPSANLVPAEWHEEKRREKQRQLLKSRLKIAAMVYVVLLLAGSVYLFWLSARLKSIETKIKKSKPEIAFVEEQQSRWNALAPAVDRQRFLIELLHQACASMSSDDLRINQFQLEQNRMSIKGEAPSVSLAIEFTDKLKANPELTAYTFDSSAPEILTDERAKFNITGKL